ncbi:hypothetical protein [Brevibacterium pigmentatum]|uniref:hypothetical protein n=1 Tax=Brevibacterium pigmentatum TaxID=1496080 RepID=UPI001D198344|nr:hypothetical protein [Brevibacterium pigmentatum]
MLAGPQLRRRLQVGERHLVQALTAQSGNEDAVIGDGQSAGARFIGRPLLHRVDEVARAVIGAVAAT